MFRAFRNIGLVAGIVRTMGKYDSLFFLQMGGVPFYIKFCCFFITLGVHPKSDLSNMRRGERLTLALQSLGPGFIKLGQALSVRADLVGKEIADDLTTLQDNIPPFETDKARQSIEDELGNSVKIAKV